MTETEIVIDIMKIKLVVLLIFLGFIAFLEMNLTFNSPIAFGDEGLHASIAKWIGTRLDYPVYMPQVGTNIYKNGFFRSPMWNIFQGSFYFLFGFYDVIVKFLVPFIGFLTGLAVYAMINKIYSQDTAIMASIITVAIPSFITYSVLLYSDLLLTFFISITVFATVLAFKMNRRKYLFLAGLFGGLSILADAAGFVVLPFFIVVFLYSMFKKRNLSQVIRFWFPAIIIFTLIVSPYFIRNLVYYKTPSCQFPNVFSTKYCSIYPDYTPQYKFEGLFSPGPQSIEFLNQGIMNYFNFAYGTIYFVPLFAIAGIVLAVYRREETDILLLLSLLVFLLIFYQSFKGRTEDMTRNLVSASAVVAVFAALYADVIGEFLKKYHKHLVWLVIFFVISISFLSARDKINSLVSVKQFIPSFFDACKWVRQNLPQNAMLLSFNTAPTIYNCERQAQWDLTDGADILLSQNVALVKERLKANGFTHIFIQKASITPQKVSAGYWTGFVDMLNQNPKDFKIVFENGPKYGTTDFTNCVNTPGCDLGEVIYEIVY